MVNGWERGLILKLWLAIENEARTRIASSDKIIFIPAIIL